MSGSVIPSFQTLLDYNFTYFYSVEFVRGLNYLRVPKSRVNIAPFQHLFGSKRFTFCRPLKIRDEELCIQSVTVFALKNHSSMSNIRVQIGGELFYTSISLMAIRNCISLM